MVSVGDAMVLVTIAQGSGIDCREAGLSCFPPYEIGRPYGKSESGLRLREIRHALGQL